MKILMLWLIWGKFCVSAVSDTESASQVQATDHEIDDEETQCDPSAPTNDEVGGDYDYCTDIANVSNEKVTTGINRASDLDNYPTGNLPTYDEALKIGVSMTNNQLRRRVSSQQSIKSDDFKAAQDYDCYDCPVYPPWMHV